MKRYGINIVIVTVMIFCMLPVNRPVSVSAADTVARVTIDADGSTTEYDNITDAWNAAVSSDTDVKIDLYQSVDLGNSYLKLDNPLCGITLNMADGVILSGSNSDYGVIYCGQGNLTINNGKINGTQYGLKIGGDGYVFINSTEVYGGNAGVYHNTGRLYIRNGTVVSGDTYGIKTNVGFMGGLEIEGGTVTGGTYSVYDSDMYGGSSIYLSGGSLTNGVCSTSGTIGDMLQSGYAYRKMDGTWVMDNTVQSISDSVKVEEIPVEITAEPADPAEVEYGYADANAPAISVTAKNIDGNTNGITYQWYQKGDNGDTLILGATSATYEPKGLAVGSHQYYCAVTYDQYTLNSSDVTVTVSKTTPAVSFKPGYKSEKDYDGQPFSDPTADELSLGGVNYGDVEFIWNAAAGSSLTEGKAVNAGKYILTVHIPQTDSFNEISITKDITINSKAGTLIVPETNISKKFGDDDFSLNCAFKEEGGSISYTSSDENVVEVSQNGMVTIKGTGTATITVTGTGNYTGTKTVDLRIDPKTLTANMVTIASGPYYYIGSPITPAVIVKDGNTTLTGGTDYTVSYENNVNVGSNAKVTVTGIGNYTGTINQTFIIGYEAIPSGKSLEDYVTISPEPINGWYSADITLTPKSGCKVGDILAGIGSNVVTISGETGMDESTKTIYVEGSDGKIHQTEFTYKLDTSNPEFGELDYGNKAVNLWQWIIGKTSMIIYVPVTDTDSNGNSGSGVTQITYTMTPVDENDIPDSSSAVTKTAEVTNGQAEITFSENFKGTISITCTDAAGNGASEIKAGTNGVIVEETAPTITSDIQEGYYDAAPALSVTIKDDKDNAITGGIDSITYQVGNDAAKAVTVDTSVMQKEVSFTIPASEMPVGVTNITIKAKDNAGNETSETITVKIRGMENQPAGRINFQSEKLTGLIPNVYYTVNGRTYQADAEGSIDIDESWLGTTINVVRKGNGSETTDSMAQELTVPARSVKTPSPLAVDGKLTGLESGTTYEISMDNGATWKNVTADKNGEIADLAPGNYIVRVSSTDSDFGSKPSIEVTITADYTADDDMETEDDDKGDAPSTGDNTPVAGLLFTVVFLGAGLVLTAKRTYVRK